MMKNVDQLSNEKILAVMDNHRANNDVFGILDERFEIIHIPPYVSEVSERDPSASDVNCFVLDFGIQWPC